MNPWQQQKSEMGTTDDFQVDEIPQHPLHRKPTKRNRGVPCGGLEGEEARVRQYQGPGITTLLHLGPNINCTQDIVLEPLTSSEKLYYASVGETRGDDTACEKASKSLCMRYGSNDIGNFKAWEGKSGVRPQLAAEADRKGQWFSDNFIVACSSSCEWGQLHIYSLLKSLRVSTNRREKGYNSERAAWVKPISYNRDMNKAHSQNKPVKHYKIAVADIGLDFVKLLHTLFTQGSQVKLTETGDLDESKFARFWHSIKPLAAKYKVDMAGIYSALKSATHLVLVETDLTCDATGTLHSQWFEQTLELSGYRVNKDSKCGLNCVKTKEYGVSEGCLVTIMGYNKFLETLENNGTGVGSSSIGSKAGYILNPSTKHLRDMFHDPDYHLHGVTRLEITFRGGWSFQSMVEFALASETFLNGCRVSCSTQDLLLELEMCISRTVAVYYPDNFSARCEAISRCGEFANPIVLAEYSRSQTSLHTSLPACTEVFCCRDHPRSIDNAGHVP